MDDPESASAEGEARYQQLLKTSPAPINLFDADGVTVWGNDAVLDLLGFEDREALVGRPVLDFIHPDYHDVAKVEIAQVVGAKEPVGPTPMELVTDDGDVLSIRVSTAPGMYRGEPIGQAIVIDDTPLVDAREAVEHQRDLIERVVDTLPDLYLMLSREGALLDWNDRVAEVTGYARAELEAMPLTDLFVEADADRILDSVSPILDGGRGVVEVELLTRDGRRIPYEFHGGVLTNGADMPPRIVGIARNVVLREERDSHLRVVDRLLRHNLRNKLNVVMGYAELARDDDVALREEHVERVLGTCRHLLDSMEKEREIVNLIVDAGTPKPLDLGPIIREEARAVRADYPDATVTVSAPESVAAVGIPNLRKAIREVLDNAIRHNPGAEPSVEVHVEADAGSVAVHVDDDGPPIPTAEEWVLEERTEAPLEHSEGMGLWFVHWVLDRSDGRLELTRCADSGNRVTLWLPNAEG